MARIFFDATLILKWGPHPPVGIPRVETALIRQALRWKASPVDFFVVDAQGRGRTLSEPEIRYLWQLVNGELPQPVEMQERSYLARLWKVLAIMWASPFVFGREFDRVAAVFICGGQKRRGIGFQISKTIIRLFKLAKSCLPPERPDAKDPLRDEDAICFLSSTSVHQLAAARSDEPMDAATFTIMHDSIPIDFPKFVGPHHARNFARDMCWQFERSDLLVCVSEYTAGRVRHHARALGSGWIPEVVVASPGAFLKGAIAGQKPSARRRAEDRKFVLYCSTIEIRKNHILLLKVWHRLAPVLGDRLPKLILCGRWGWMYEEVAAFIAQNPEIEKHVEFRSNLTDQQLADLYRNAEFSVYPSVVEGWGLGAAECLDFGLPVLVSDAPSLVEATQGLMPTIPAHDMEAWYAAVTRACTDPEWLEQLRATIASRYRPILERDYFAAIVEHAAALHELDAPDFSVAPGMAGTGTDPRGSRDRQRSSSLAGAFEARKAT